MAADAQGGDAGRAVAGAAGVAGAADARPKPRPCASGPLPYGPIVRARALLADMRQQAELFPEWTEADPAWAIMLDLLIQQDSGRQVSVQSVCVASGVPQTTALRHLARLVRRGDLIRTADPHDRRRWFVALSASARQRLFAYLAGEPARG